MIGGRTVEDVRADFPILSRLIGGRPLAYLDNAATSQKPRAVIDAMRSFYEHGNANVHRAMHALGEEATAAFEAARATVAAFLNASRPSEIVFTRGATESINLVAFAWADANLKEDDVVLLSEMEHHSNLVPWQQACRRAGCRLAFMRVHGDGELDLDEIERAWDPRTRLVAVTHMSNVLGTVNDVKAIAAMAHAHGSLVLVDAAQSVPHLGVDVGDLGCDLLAFSGHKAYGPMGIGVLYGREAVLDSMPPWMTGGEMVGSVSGESATWNELPWRFEAGTANVAGAIGLAAAIDYVNGLGLAAIAAREEELAQHAFQRLGDVKGLALFGPPKRPAAADSVARRGPLFSFVLDGVHGHDIAQFLDREGIAVRAGHLCAQPLVRKLGVPGLTRASLSFYNTFGEIDRLADALEAARRFSP